MQLITSTITLAKIFQSQLKSCTSIHFAVAWASAGFSEYEALIKNKRKLTRAVIGTHFYQTPPEVIEKFLHDDRVRFVTDHSGVFHPKIYVFEHKKNHWACLIGSANFTAGGFGKNREASLLITDDDDCDGGILKDALAAIEGYWSNAKPADEIDLHRYREMRKRFVRTFERASGRFGAGKTGFAIEEVDVLNLNWNDFLIKVKKDKHHGIHKRLDVLKAARNLFQRHQTFKKMPIEGRQGIAGFLQSEKISWGWFGSMWGAGTFKKIVNENPGAFSDALDRVPLVGKVTREDYIEFTELFISGFPIKNGQRTRHGLGTATRLLAMKRPDYFVCLDGANRRGLFKDFGITIANQDYEGYWDEIVERLKIATWWNARRPTEFFAEQIWNGRAAMLDAIYYVPSS